MSSAARTNERGGTAGRSANEETANLGDRSVFIRRAPGGGIAAVWQQVRLEEAKGHLYWQGRGLAISASGYQFCNRIAGLSIITPDSLTLPDGRSVVNPFPVTDPDTNQITQVWCKKIAVGYGPTGNLVVTTSTLLYDCRVYLLEEVYKKFVKNKKIGVLRLHGLVTDEDRKKYLPLRITPEITLLADPENEDVIEGLGTYIQRMKFAERLAQSIAERNALRHHPALSFSQVNAQGEQGRRSAVVQVIGWTHQLSQDELLEIARRANEGRPIDNATVIDLGTAAADEEDEAAAVEEVDTEGGEAPDLPTNAGALPAGEPRVDLREALGDSTRKAEPVQEKRNPRAKEGGPIV